MYHQFFLFTFYVFQVIPSRLPDGQVVFLLPSHYVQGPNSDRGKGVEGGPAPDQEGPLDFSVKREDELLPVVKQEDEIMDTREDDVWRPW